MNTCAGVFAVSCNCEPSTGARALQRERQLNQFFVEVERRALRIAEIAVRSRDEALDLVQEAMIKMARNYAERPSDEWTPVPVPDAVLQDPVEQRRPLILRLLAVILYELDHRDLHEIKGFVPVAHGDFSVAQRATLDVLKESI